MTEKRKLLRQENLRELRLAQDEGAREPLPPSQPCTGRETILSMCVGTKVRALTYEQMMIFSLSSRGSAPTITTNRSTQHGSLYGGRREFDEPQQSIHPRHDVWERSHLLGRFMC